MNLSIQDELHLFFEELYYHVTLSLLNKLEKALGFIFQTLGLKPPTLVGSGSVKENGNFQEMN